MSEYWGYHLILDCKNGRKLNEDSEEDIRVFIKELVDKIDMVAYGEPNIAYLPTPSRPECSGWSVVQLIYTSSITCHFADDSGDFYLDVFSCKIFDVDLVIDYVQQYFSPSTIKQTYLLRSTKPEGKYS
tara:strand:- start:2289 stop:2675 length:387 start_codon:yes stop_codon:yes gene_type:complete